MGKEKVQHILHENILTQCPFFEKCLNSGMREQHERVINLPEDSPKAFSIIVEWLYTKDVSSELNHKDFRTSYVAADKYGIPELQNTLMDRLRAMTSKELSRPNKVLAPVWVTEIWDEAMDGSCRLREMSVDLLHYFISKTPYHYQSQPDNPNIKSAQALRKVMANPDLGYALMLRFANKGNSNLEDPRSKIGCFYHVHEDGKKCGGSA